MDYLLDAAQMKAADRYTVTKLGISSMELMERAAASCVRSMEREGWDMSRICIVCGSGNNGGDGFAIGRILLGKGKAVTAVFAGRMESRTGETARQMQLYEQAGGRIAETYEPGDYSIIVDALFGVGLSRDVTGHYRKVLEQMNQAGGKKLAVDIPSGISASTGQVMGTAFQADMTVSFQEEKLGLCLFPGCEYAGNVVAADIGIDISNVTDSSQICYSIGKRDAAAMLPERPADSHKGTFGKLLLIAGSKGMAGAAYLSAYGAYRSGAGLVRVYTAEENRCIIQQLLPEAVVTAYGSYDGAELRSMLSWADTVCIGSGIGISDTSQSILNTVLNHAENPCIIDADGLNILAGHPDWMKKLRNGDYILTPHMKELSRLTGRPVCEIKKNRRQVIESFTAEYKAVLVQKDSRTMVGACGRKSYVNRSGGPAMAKAGAGDVLAGVISGLRVQGMNSYDSAVLGVYLHGLAGDIAGEQLGSYSVLARELADGIASAMQEVEREKDESR